MKSIGCKSSLFHLTLFLTFIIFFLPTYLLSADACAPSDHSYTMSTLNTSEAIDVTMSKNQSISYYIKTQSAGILTIATSNSNNKIHLNGSETICPTATNSGITTITYTNNNASFDVNIVVFASNAASHTLTINFFSTETPPAFNGPISNINTIIGSTYSFDASTYFLATNGDTITYSNTNGSALPAGLTLNTSTGIISGTPTTLGTYPNIIITATDKDGFVNSNPFTMTISSPPVVSFTCANPKTFTPIYNGDDYSKLVLIGNNSLCKNNGGVCGIPNASTNNNDINMMYNDYDDSQLDISISATTTLNSTAARLDIPVGKKILWAGLFWQGYMVDANATQKSEGRSIKYMHEDDATGYKTQTNAAMNWVYFNEHRMYYQSFIEITSYVKTQGAGYYWVGDIATTQGQPEGGSFGAWSLAVVYEDYTEDFKNIAVFHGYQAFAGSSDINNAISYANAHSCDNTKTGVGTAVSSTLTGFLTPQTNAVNSSLIVFAGEGDIGLTGDSGSITDISGTQHALTNTLNPPTNIMNSTISKDGATVTTGKPYLSANSLGIDIDTYDISAIIENGQSSTNIEFTSSGDGYMPGMYGFSTQLYVPKFCYDYAYKQNNLYFTEDNNGSFRPKVTGLVSTGTPVEVSLYIRNEEASDIRAINTVFNILDINTTQATYIANTTQVIYPNSIAIIDISDDLLTSQSQIVDIPIGSVGGSEYFYTYYQINPIVGNLDLSLNAEFSYDFVFATGQKHYTTTLNDQIPLCTSNNFTYNPIYRTFNVEHPDLFPLQKYNLRTQITKRADTFKVVSYDVNKTVNNIHQRKDVNTSVAVELIDAGGFHDTTAACYDPSSSISQRVWINIYDSNNTNFSAADIINNSIIPNPKAAEEFYSIARENVAFRLSYNVLGDSDELVDVQPSSDGGFYIANFAAFKYTDDTGGLTNQCREDVITESHTYKLIPDACGNASSSNGMTQERLNICLECVYGYNIQYVCSRDNFSIRPEAFLVKLKDQNQTTLIPSVIIDDNVSGVLSPSNTTTHLAAGYQYNIEINATNYIDNTASLGYSKSFTDFPDDNATYKWNGLLTCNMTDDQNISDLLTFSNGHVNLNSTLSNVGKYLLNITDTRWTRVDHDPAYMIHHDENGIYFYPSSQADCDTSSSNTQDINSSLPNGCQISSNHNNTSSSLLKYRDYNITSHPYKFSLNLTPSYSVARNTNFTNGWIYMNDINNSADINMSMHLDGDIIAAGFDNSSLSNFVTGCYAQDINMTLGFTTSSTPPLRYQYRLFDLNASNDVITTLPPTASNPGDINTTIQLSEGNFTTDLNGTTTIELYVNFDRNITTSVNPITVSYSDYNTTCTADINCTMHADLISNHKTTGTLLINQNLIHYYGRVHAPDYRYDSLQGNATVFYEVYSNQNKSTRNSFDINGSESVDNINWYVNSLHDNLSEGNVTLYTSVGDVRFKSNTSDTTNSAHLNNIANGSEIIDVTAPILPYKDKINFNSSSWLIYNPTDFIVEFYGVGTWAGQGKLGDTVDLNVSTIQNKNIDW